MVVGTFRASPWHEQSCHNLWLSLGWILQRNVFRRYKHSRMSRGEPESRRKKHLKTWLPDGRRWMLFQNDFTAKLKLASSFCKKKFKCQKKCWLLNYLMQILSTTKQLKILWLKTPYFLSLVRKNNNYIQLRNPSNCLPFATYVNWGDCGKKSFEEDFVRRKYII